MNVFIAYTVDQVEGLIAAALGSDNIEELRHISADLRRAGENVKAWAMAVGGSPILDLGTIGAVQVPADRMTELPGIVQKFADICEGTLSVGVGMTISEAQTAMKYSSVKGGDQIALYTPEMEDEIADIDQPSEDPLLQELGKSSKTGSEGPTGFADGPSDDGGSSTPQASPAEGNSPMAQSAPASSGPAPASSPTEGQVEDPNAQQDEQDPKTAVIQALQNIKAQAPVLEQMKESNPEAFEAVKNVVQAMIIMAQGMAQEEQGGESVQKAEPGVAPQLHNTVEGFMGGLKALPKGSPQRGKFITSNMNHAPFLSALQQHPQGKQIHSMLTTHLNGTANAGFKPGATQAVVKDELPVTTQKVPHEESQGDENGERSPAFEESESSSDDAKVAGSDDHNFVKKNVLPSTKTHNEYAVGTQKDGKIKVAHMDPATGENKGSGWRSVRAGIVMSQDGHAASARNPGTS